MDAAELKSRATEAFAKGRFAKAGELYRDYCKAAPKDLQSRLRMGDAWARAHHKDRAIDAYKEAAEGFARDGFLPRAIAASKLILELDPAHQGVQQMLADLYAQRGLGGGGGRKATAVSPAPVSNPKVIELPSEPEPAPALQAEDDGGIELEVEGPALEPEPTEAALADMEPILLVAPAAKVHTIALGPDDARDLDFTETLSEPPAEPPAVSPLEIEIEVAPENASIEASLEAASAGSSELELAGEAGVALSFESAPRPAPRKEVPPSPRPSTAIPLELDDSEVASEILGKLEAPRPVVPGPPPPPSRIIVSSHAAPPGLRRKTESELPAVKPSATPPGRDRRDPSELRASFANFSAFDELEPGDFPLPGPRAHKGEPPVAAPSPSSSSGARAGTLAPVASAAAASASTATAAAASAGSASGASFGASSAGAASARAGSAELGGAVAAATMPSPGASTTGRPPAEGRAGAARPAQAAPAEMAFTELELTGESLLHAVELAAQQAGLAAADEEPADQPSPDEEPADAGPPEDELPRIPLFSDLPQEAFIALFERSPLRRLGMGERIITQGSVGDAFYVICEGAVRVVREEDGQERELARLAHGSFFGEMALLSGAPRTASVESVEEDTQLLEISAPVLSELSREHPQIATALRKFCRQRMLSNVMESSSLFRPFSKSDRRTVIEKFRAREVKQGDVVIQEGQRSDGLYVVLAGELEVRRQDQVLAQLKEGELFGEMSLLEKTAANASVRALKRTSLLRLPREAFDALILSHPQILMLISELTEDRRRRNQALSVPSPAAFPVGAGEEEPVVLV